MQRRVVVWHHAGGAAPQYVVTSYRDNGALWTPWKVNTYRVRIGLQDLTENIIDRAHFWTVHDMDLTTTYSKRLSRGRR
jgi:hypothetical protein